MVSVREASTEEWQVLRDIRLAALLDAPDAFDSTYEEQAACQEAEWRHRIASGSTFFAFLPGANGTDPAGLVRGFQDMPGTVELVSLWVRPQARGRGVGDALVAAVIDWAKARKAGSVHLWLTEANFYARLLYERCGFSLTGERQPLPSNPDLIEVGMALRMRHV
jgi:GNAT superfamily N-acetyltransferase